MTNTDSVQNLVEVLEQAFNKLGLNIEPKIIRSLANLIHQAMNGEGRYYHTPAHALRLSNPSHPVQSLAALFHDIIYFQIDQGFPADTWEIIAPYLTIDGEDEKSLSLSTSVPAGEASFHLVREIFGFPAGHHLYANGGLNEFLSSLVMAKKLENIVSKKTLVQIIACIEATIPFRTSLEQDMGPFEHLAQRLERVSREHDIILDAQEIDSTIQEAVALANKDVENFTNPDTATFLDGTWLLLPEFNPALRKGLVYSLQDYRLALQAMGKFLCSIAPESVLHEYKGVPSPRDLEMKLPIVRKNLSLGCEYLQIKLLTAAILEALANISQENEPLSYYVGDVSKNGRQEDDLGSFLPPVKQTAPGVDRDSALYQLLQTGRRGPVDFADVKTSNLASFIYASSGHEKILTYLASAHLMFTGKIKPDEFLQVLDAELLAIISNAVAQLSKRRREKVE